MALEYHTEKETTSLLGKAKVNHVTISHAQAQFSAKRFCNIFTSCLCLVTECIMAKTILYCVLILGVVDSAFFLSVNSFKKSIHIADHLRDKDFALKKRSITLNLKDSVHSAVNSLPDLVKNAGEKLISSRRKRQVSHNPTSSKVI